MPIDHTLIRDALKKAISGYDVSLDLKNGEYTDCCNMTVRVKNGVIDLYGDYDGPLNQCDPVLKTNIFSMEKEQDYYLYIDDLFGGNDEASSELIVDLIKTTLE